jgi:hypothetical protein
MGMGLAIIHRPTLAVRAENHNELNNSLLNQQGVVVSAPERPEGFVREPRSFSPTFGTFSTEMPALCRRHT